MDSQVIEWCFDCDRASQKQNEVFNTVMNRDWLREHGISPIDIDAAWEEAANQLRQVGEQSPLIITRLGRGKPDPCWENFWANQFKVTNHYPLQLV